MGRHPAALRKGRMNHLDPAIINSFMLAVIALLGGINLYLRSKADQNADKRAAWSRAQDLRTAQVMDNTHTLVNNAMGAQLQITATTAQTLADTTHNPVHVAAAAIAQKALADHMQRQREMDRT